MWEKSDVVVVVTEDFEAGEKVAFRELIQLSDTNPTFRMRNLRFELDGERGLVKVLANISTQSALDVGYSPFVFWWRNL